ncbi:MAG TPA: hypothetical protein VFR80_07730, partial [Pyrinomonadaceae bacterium]|nr:hypothetical protein [Pyrinomonadaceae bacterium]
LTRDAHLFPVRPALRFTSRFTRYGIGDKVFAGPNPSYGALITYYLKDKPDDKATFKVEIFDQAGKLVQALNRPAKEKGMNRVAWNLRFGGAEVRQPPPEEESATFGSPRGPQVLPGIYMVRLTLGEKKLEERVEVRLDPTVNTPLADLQSQLELTTKLRDMQSAVNTSLRFLDSIKDQLKHTQTTMRNLNKEPDKDMTKALEDYVKKVEELQDRLARRTEGLGLGGKSRVADRVGDLFFSIDAPNAAPTRYQRSYFDEVEPEFRERMLEVNKFIAETVPQWNEKLRGWNAPTLTTRKPVDF